MTKFIAFVSGKGGVGKTTTTLNVGQALANYDQKVTLVDANLVTPNLAIQLGFMNPDATLNHFLRKEKGIHEVTYLHESGVSLILASPSYAEFQKTNIQHIGKVFDHLHNTTDYVLVDSPSGLGVDVSHVIKNCDEVVIVTNPNLSSVMDALKTIKLAKEYRKLIVGVVLNMTHGGKHELSEKEVHDILGYPILTSVKRARKVRKSIHKQMPVNYLYPRSGPAKSFRKVAEHLMGKK